MKGANPNMHKLISLSLPWCCFFPFSSDFKLLILSSPSGSVTHCCFSTLSQQANYFRRRSSFFV